MASLGTRPDDGKRLIELLERYGIESGLDPEQSAVRAGGRFVPGTAPDQRKRDPAMEAVQRFVRSFTYANIPWREAQQLGMLWAPLRKPHENALDPHWIARKSVTDVAHPELGRSFRYATSKWIGTATGWSVGRRAPLLNEDAASVDAPPARGAPVISATPQAPDAEKPSPRGKPFPLNGIRILDFTWFLASAGGTRFLSAFGAESIKVELKSHPDTRMAAMAPVGGRAARDKATAPLPAVSDPDMGGQFNNKNPGKRGISLNVRHPKGLEIARRLVAMSDIVAEGFSPGVLDSWGLGYDALRAIKPDIIYVQQSGMGAQGTYGRFRTVGPVANSFAGLSEMSGLPEPAMPAGWGYSYLDWMGAYSFALAMLTGLYPSRPHRRGPVDRRVADRGRAVHQRHDAARLVGQRPHLVAHRQPLALQAGGAARRLSLRRRRPLDRHRLLRRRGMARAGRGRHGIPNGPPIRASPRSRDGWRTRTRSTRPSATWTRTGDAYAMMHALQKAGVPAGVCQTAEDRCDHDPQLAELEWLTEVTGTKIGRWPIAEVPVKLSKSPAYIGGRIDRGAPCYGEDNEYVYGELLGMTTKEIAALADDGVI